MNIRQRCKRKARKVKIESMILDFDDNVSIQIPIFVDAKNVNPEEEIARAVRGALLFDAAKKGGPDIVDVEVTVENRDVHIEWIGRAG